MADHSATATNVDAQSNPVAAVLAKHHFLLRRLHSLSGIVPVGLFVIMHLFTNAQIIFSGPADDPFQHEVDFIHSVPALLFIEIALWLSIGFHAVLGVLYMVGWAPNAMRYQHGPNWRYTLQRITAWTSLIFILLHISTLRWRINLLDWNTPFYWRGEDVPGLDEAMANVPMTTPLTAYALQFHWLVVVLYVIGVSSVIYHWCNGLWTAAIMWGMTISTAAQRRWGYVCIGLAVALTASAGAAIVGALIYDLNTATSPAQREILQQITAWEPAG